MRERCAAFELTIDWHASQLSRAFSAYFPTCLLMRVASVCSLGRIECAPIWSLRQMQVCVHRTHIAYIVQLLLLLSDECCALLLFLLAQCQVWLPSINTRARVHWKWRETPTESNGNENIYFLHCALASSVVAFEALERENTRWSNNSTNARPVHVCVVCHAKRKALTRPSTIIVASGGRWGLSVTIGTDGAFGMARPRSIIAGCIWPDRRCGGRSWRKPETHTFIII